MSAACHDPAPAARSMPATSGDLTIALAGRPNSGKSSLYNAITGGEAHVGNYPGITVETLEGEVEMPAGGRATVADLLGLYSVEATVDSQTDEGVARTFLDAAGSEVARSFSLRSSIPHASPSGLRLTRELRGRSSRSSSYSPIATCSWPRVARSTCARSATISVSPSCSSTHAIRAGAKRAVLAAVEERARERKDTSTTTHFEPADLAKRVVRDVASDREFARRRLTERVHRVLLHPLRRSRGFRGAHGAAFCGCVPLSPIRPPRSWIS